MKKVLLIFLMAPVLPLFSHGSEYTILSDRVVKIEVKYDTGEFIADADVIVFPPGQKEAQYTVQTDKKGIFYIEPDREGTWILQVRGGNGHGMRINLPVDDSMLIGGSGTNRLSLLQKLIMLLSVAWGTAGTVLYFRKRY